MWLITLLHSSNFLLAVLIIYYLGGIQRNLLYAFAMFVYFVFTLYTPTVNYWTGNTVLYGTDFSDYHTQGMLIYTVGVFAFSISYYLIARRKKYISFSFIQQLPDYSWRWLDVFFYGCWIIIFLNVQLGGRNFIQMFDLTNPDWRLGVWGFEGAIPYLADIPDTLTAVLIMAIATSTKRTKLLCWIVPTFVMFLLFGWRYRIIFVLLAFIFNYLLTQQNSRSTWAKLVAMLLVAGLVVNFITLNRWAVAKREFDKVRWDLTLFTNDLLLNETNNSQTFFSTIKYIQEKNIPPDYGETMFLFTLYRAIPARFFENNKKPEPPNLAIMHQAFDPEIKGEGNPAICNIAEYYLSFRWLGVIVGMSILGILLALLSPDVQNLNYKAVYLTICAFLFQVITRGYFPQNVELLAYLSLPYFVFVGYQWAKNNIKL
jgi:hypothetical protein